MFSLGKESAAASAALTPLPLSLPVSVPLRRLRTTTTKTPLLKHQNQLRSPNSTLACARTRARVSSCSCSSSSSSFALSLRGHREGKAERGLGRFGGSPGGLSVSICTSALRSDSSERKLDKAEEEGLSRGTKSTTTKARIISRTRSSSSTTSGSFHTDSSALVGQDQIDYCPGCGIKVQSESKDKPGFYQMPASKSKQKAPRFAVDMDASEIADAEVVPAYDLEGEPEPEPEVKRDVFCARCFSLRNYGKVKNPEIEDQLPSFDVASKLCSRIANIKGIRQVLLCVVDITDFDGSIPTETLSKLFSDPQIAQKNISFIFALNKVDLLPRVASDQRLQSWTRRQISSLNLPEDVTVKLVSAVAGKGIAELAGTLQSKVGQYGHLWVFGAQNAGRSSLINALRRYANGEKPAASRNSRNNSKSKGNKMQAQTQQLTEASLPGTTIGFVRLDNVLPNRCKAFDTPGILHKYQFTSTYSPLSYEEIGMLLPRRKLKPRTFRCMVGYSVSIGGLARVELVAAPGKSVYLTLWASDEVTHHFGKTENAEKKQSQAVGDVLYPPTSKEAMPHLVPSEFLVNGDSWKRSSEDIAIAGLGWVAVGVSGQCSLRVWSPKSVLVYQREALMPDYAENFERPGYGQMLPNSKK